MHSNVFEEIVFPKINLVLKKYLHILEIRVEIFATLCMSLQKRGDIEFRIFLVICIRGANGKFD